MMGGWLARLKNENMGGTHATKATKPQQGGDGVGFVGFVAYPPTPIQKIEEDKPTIAAGNSPIGADSDRWCWPHSEAMNTGEIDAFTARLVRFTDKGLIHAVAEPLTDKLMQRDRDSDDRRLCLECIHLHGAGRWRCGNWMRANVARDGLPRDLVLMLQRCPGFKEVAP